MRIAPPCKVDRCKIPADTYKGGARGWCVKHYRRFQRNGDPLRLINDGSGFVNEKGYRMLPVGGHSAPEHRAIVEAFLGRKLAPIEIVHHKNHDKLDNRIENLELTDRARHCVMHLPRLGTGKREPRTSSRS